MGVAAVANSTGGRVVMDLRAGESIAFAGTGIAVTVVAKSGRATRLCVESPRDIMIEREDAENERPKARTLGTSQPVK